MQARDDRVWGGSTIPEDAPHGAALVDLFLTLGAIGLLALSIDFAREWRTAYRPSVEIDLSVRALPAYALYSLARGLTAYVLSLGFTLLYGYWAARDRVAERVLVPSVKDTDAEVLATGTSCRHQIADLASREAVHPITFLASRLEA